MKQKETMPRAIPETAVEAMLARESSYFTLRNANSRRLSERTAKNWLKGVPMHWMVDWGTPFPLFVAKARGVDVIRADGNLRSPTQMIGEKTSDHILGRAPLPLSNQEPWINQNLQSSQR
jgi:hypothetical protein